MTATMAPPAATAAADTQFRMRGLEMTRIETFTDAAFAFALTLLVISLEPPTSVDGMFATLRGVPAFILSAVMLMTFWWGHHEWSRRYGLDDGPTMILSCLLVFTVLVYVYPLRFMTGALVLWVGQATGLPIGSGELTIRSASDVADIFFVYGIGFVAMCATIVLLNLHAWRLRDHLALTPWERHDTRSEIGAWLILMTAGLLSILVTLLIPPRLVGLAGWAYATLGFVMPAFARLRARSRVRLR